MRKFKFSITNLLPRDKAFTLIYPFTQRCNKNGQLVNNVSIIYKSSNSLSYYFKNCKNCLESGDAHFVVYKISCANCDAIYIGQTKRALTTRLKEHGTNIKLSVEKH